LKHLLICNIVVILDIENINFTKETIYMVKSKHKKRYHRSKKSRTSTKEHLIGTVTIAPGGYGFLKPANGEYDEDIFIPPKYLNNIMNGDKVEVELRHDKGPRKPGKGPIGKVIKIITRGRDTLVGELVHGHKVKPLSRSFGDTIEISGSLNGAKKGDWVQVNLLHTDGVNDKHQKCAINKKIGEVGKIQSDLQAVIHEYELPYPYTEEEDDQAKDIKPVEVKREDLRDRFTITLDPIDAKDFDDAISFVKTGKDNIIEIGVHIADVAAWIRPGSYWDKEARKRGFTAYLPGKTLPMLPKTLTRMISLTDDADSFAHTVLIQVDADTGKIIKSRRCYSTIRVNKRLNYDEVQEFIDGDSKSDWSDELRNSISTMVDLTRKMREWRTKEEHFLELAVPEIRVLCNEETNEILGLAKKIQRESEELVEECMLAANQEVAVEMISRKIPGVYRVHPEPEPERLEEFVGLCIATIARAPKDLSTRKACNFFLASLEDDEKKPIIVNAFLRSLARAYYLEKPELHFGLGKEKYSHFTSPIRRYSDTLVHQQLLALELGEKTKTEAALKDLCIEISAKEKNNDDAFYAANDRMKLRYLEESLGEGADNRHEAVIIKVNPSGMQVDIVNVGIYGFVPGESLAGFSFDRKKTAYISTNKNIAYAPGNIVYLRLDQVDFTQGVALFGVCE
jgi:ribonuclease R